MEKLADKGNGNYAYIDTLHGGAPRAGRAEAGATLVTVAKDVKIQVEFNPTAVGAYRLIGYENRLLAKEDFNDDKKDAGEIGAGHTVTALYEIVPARRAISIDPSVDPLKYQRPAGRAGAGSDELMTVKLRYKAPDGDASRLMSVAVANRTAEIVGEPRLRGRGRRVRVPAAQVRAQGARRRGRQRVRSPGSIVATIRTVIAPSSCG